MNKFLNEKSIYTIGHSTHTIEKLIAMLQSFKIETIIDIRSYPGSKRYPHFNKEVLQTYLPGNNIGYIPMKTLGGRRKKPKKDSVNTSWRNKGFRGYADYMETDDFRQALIELENIATKSLTAYRCAEAVWWHCHIALVSDYLKAEGWHAIHIFSIQKSEKHIYTEPAKIINGRLNYTGQEKDDLLLF